MIAADTLQRMLTNLPTVEETAKLQAYAEDIKKLG
jgi:hypothetical protein